LARLGITLLAWESIFNLGGLTARARGVTTIDHSFLDRVTGTIAQSHSNFRATYTDDKKARDFFPFLENVFHVLPPVEFQKMIRESSIRFSSDPEIYREVIRRLPEVKPFFSEFSYALPALKIQKKELASQSFQLLGENRRIHGYLEMGSPGRYLGTLKEGLEISGPVYIFNDVKPGYSPIDIMERGGLAKNGTYVPMGNYNLLPVDAVPNESLDLITNFIGFHHCPAERKPAFILSLKRALRKGGTLLLRDHDVGRNRATDSKFQIGRRDRERIDRPRI
jgi:hypothetical protein